MRTLNYKKVEEKVNTFIYINNFTNNNICFIGCFDKKQNCIVIVTLVIIYYKIDLRRQIYDINYKTYDKANFCLTLFNYNRQLIN